MRLRDFAQKYLLKAELGTDEAPDGNAAATAEDAHADLRRVQAHNDLYFKSYWIMLMAIFLITVAIALLYRDQMGGLAAVLGTGGVVQGGLILQLSAALREKVNTDMVAALSRRLPPEQLQKVLMAILEKG